MANSHTRPFGQHGEKLAAEYLIKRGYTISDVNWRCAHGEIDIIARKEDMLVFVEVRTRHSETPETAFASINKHKRDKLVTLAEVYISTNNLDTASWRVDVIGIAFPNRQSPIINHVEDALDW